MVRHIATMLIGFSLISQAPTFDVVTVKKTEIPPRTLTGCRGLDAGPETVPQGRCRITGALRRLIVVAYGIQPHELKGADGWMESEFWTIEGVAADTATAKQAELLAMLRHQLEESFKLKFHREPVPVSGYRLTISDERKLTPWDGVKPIKSGFWLVRGTITAWDGPLSKLSTFIAARLNAPVVDATDTLKLFEVHLKFGEIAAPEEWQAALLAELASSGLKLKAEKASVDVMVIDSAQKPE